MDIYKDNLWIGAKLEDLGRKDWHHNHEGKVDYFPLGTGMKKTGNEIPLEEQKYDIEWEITSERGTSNLEAWRESQPDWEEYERIMHCYN